MKRLKVGAKILLGFGIVLAMMIVIAVTIVFSSTTTLDNVDSIDKNSELQVKTSDLMANFYEARIYANIMYSIISDEAYDSFGQRIANCEAKLADIYASISQTPVLEGYRQQFQAFEEKMNAWHTGVDNVQKDNESIIALSEKSIVIGAHLDAVGDKAFLNQMDSLRALESGNLSAGDINYRADRLALAEKISSGVRTLRMNFRVMIDTFDISEHDNIMTLLDDIEKDVKQYKDLVAQQINKDAAQEILDALEQYRICIVDFVTMIENADDTMTATRPVGIEALDKLSDVVASVDDAMARQVEDTVSTAASSLILVVAISVLSVAVSVILALVIKSGITRPLVLMSAYLERVKATGAMRMTQTDTTAIKKYSEYGDETGQCVNAISNLISRLLDIDEKLCQLADGDLTVDIEVLSEKDSLGLAFTKTLDSLNNMFGEINSSTKQVSNSSKLIADGAQSLAQGSTEQAAAVQELSVSISEIADKTNQNASIAREAASLSDVIRDNAEKGNRQMDQMMRAVKEINDASGSISKVIKVIDDIAFQTNILALNAAVEAARAGSAGKGFAVVAEEVRNLAAKSAEAAKDTGELIEDSIEKANLGLGIATETAASLREIVDGINRSSEIVSQIARLSDEQASATEQINTGIDQVAQVVHQNSATAEESAAASQEMSGQSIILQEMVGRFRLRNDIGGTGHTAMQSVEAGSFTIPAQAHSLSLSPGNGLGKY